MSGGAMHRLLAQGFLRQVGRYRQMALFCLGAPVQTSEVKPGVV
jgi:hypothetical protein